MTDTHVLAMRPCPQCECVGVTETADSRWESCALCNGDKFVSYFKAAQWELEAGRALDSSKPPPPPESR